MHGVLRSDHGNHTMHAHEVSHESLHNACFWMHAARRNVLEVAILAAIDERRLSVTGMGRAIGSDANRSVTFPSPLPYD